LLVSRSLVLAETTSRYNEPYPRAASKKGLQVEMVDDALALGVKHAALNINLTALFVRGESADALSYASNGETFHFQRGYVEGMDRQIKQLSDAGVLVNLIVLTYASGVPEVDRIVLHPNYNAGRGRIANTVSWSATSLATRSIRTGGGAIRVARRCRSLRTTICALCG
jgi:hypothetical protein